ncbi:MAG: hypothetical protein WCJ01_02165 [Ignavibacteria bacterium]
MKSHTVPVMDIEFIEKELSLSKAGVLGFIDVEENLVQNVYPFLYANKNIYIFLEDIDETFQKLNFDLKIIFTVISTENIEEDDPDKSGYFYKFMQIKFTGNVKIEGDKKIVDDLYNQFLQKYSYDESNLEYGYLSRIQILSLDTEEIQAAIVTWK